jgi:hypothetical protein
MKRRLIIALIAAVLFVPALSAQIPGGTIPDVTATASPTAGVTNSLFGTDVDDIQDVNTYSDVEFTNGFGYAYAASGLGVGFATHIGNLFLGVTYNGYLWSGSLVRREDDGKEDNPVGVGSGPGVAFGNRLDVLIGSESFGGIKLLVFFDDFGRQTDKDETVTPSEEAVNSEGSIYLAGIWGKNFSLGGGTLKPEFGLGVQFDADGNYEYESGPASVTYKAGYTSIALRAAADYEFAPKGNATTILSGDYTFILHLKPNPALEGKNVTVPASLPFGGTTVTSIEARDEGAFIQNALNAVYIKKYDINDRISAAWKAGGSLAFDFYEEKWSSTINGVKSPSVKGTTTTEFTITPGAAAAVTYNFGNKPFSVNAGVALGTSWSVEKIDNKDSKIVTTTYTFTPLTPPTFNLGGTLKPSEEFTLDLYLTGTGTRLSNYVFYFNATNIQVGFLLSFKF